MTFPKEIVIGNIFHKNIFSHNEASYKAYDFSFKGDNSQNKDKARDYYNFGVDGVLNGKSIHVDVRHVYLYGLINISFIMYEGIKDNNIVLLLEKVLKSKEAAVKGVRRSAVFVCMCYSSVVGYIFLMSSLKEAVRFIHSLITFSEEISFYGVNNSDNGLS